MITNFEDIILSIEDRTGLAKKIAEILQHHQGKKSAITGEMICWDIAQEWEREIDVRVLRKVIADMRLHGFPIGSSGKGYYLLNDKEETRRVIQSLVDRVSAIEAVIAAMTEMFRENYGETPEVQYT